MAGFPPSGLQRKTGGRTVDQGWEDFGSLWRCGMESGAGSLRRFPIRRPHRMIFPLADGGAGWGGSSQAPSVPVLLRWCLQFCASLLSLCIQTVRRSIFASFDITPDDGPAVSRTVARKRLAHHVCSETRAEGVELDMAAIGRVSPVMGRCSNSASAHAFPSISSLILAGAQSRIGHDWPMQRTVWQRRCSGRVFLACAVEHGPSYFVARANLT
jgi:hypothetical protein